jgi:hypothetical protein
MYNLYNSAKRNHRDRQPPIKINQNNMLLVEKSAHLGILRSKSKEKTEATHIEQNITKARRTAYSLLSAGCLHILLNRVMHLMSIIASTGSSPERI